MPTLPPERSPGSESHRQRALAESFGADTDRYDRTRPGYPAELIERIAAASPGPDVLDVGIGTGIAARQLQQAGCRVHGVEPDARMAESARRLGIEVDVATFEDWNPRGRGFDAVVAAQAWHWVDPVAGAAQAARVLRPQGRLALLWNAFQLPPEVAEPVVAACKRAMPDMPAAVTDALAEPGLEVYVPGFAKAAEGIRQAGAFSEPEQWRRDWQRHYTRSAWLEQMPTFGILTRLPAEPLAEVLESAGAAIDALGGGFTMEYTTVAVTASRTGQA